MVRTSENNNCVTVLEPYMSLAVLTVNGWYLKAIALGERWSRGGGNRDETAGVTVAMSLKKKEL